MPDTRDRRWTSADLVAIDLEGSGPQDPAGEVILEIALVPLRAGAPDVDGGYTTVINPERPIRRGPWISPGLTTSVLAAAPTLATVAPRIAELVTGSVLVGHNVAVDWRLLHTHIPDAKPAALLDTLRLAKARRPDLKRGHGLAAWIERLDLIEPMTAAAPGSQPHRALWDAVAAAELLVALINTSASQPDLVTLLDTAGVPLHGDPAASRAEDQLTLWHPL